MLIPVRFYFFLLKYSCKEILIIWFQPISKFSSGLTPIQAGLRSLAWTHNRRRSGFWAECNCRSLIVFVMRYANIGKENDWNEDFVKELKTRSRSFANVTARTYSWEETKAATIKKVKSKNR